MLRIKMAHVSEEEYEVLEETELLFRPVIPKRS